MVYLEKNKKEDNIITLISTFFFKIKICMYFKSKIKLFKAIILNIEKAITEQIQGLVQRNNPREQVRRTSQPLDETVFFSKCPFDLFFSIYQSW